ncbi:hypothetical protein [Pseudomonas sp. G3-19]
MILVSSETSKIYNMLPDVFDADRMLHEPGRKKSVDQLLDIVRKHKVESFVGLRLLHKHNLIAEHELMVEGTLSDEIGFALITRARSISEIGEAILPNSWILTDTGYVPMEFSATHLLNDPTFNPISHNKFFDELASKLRELGLSNILGPALASSSFVESHRPSDSSMMIELSVFDDRANVLRFVTDQVSEGDFIETYWLAGPESDDINHPRDPKPDTAQPLRTCKRICPSVQNPPVHQGTYQHSSS